MYQIDFLVHLNMDVAYNFETLLKTQVHITCGSDNTKYVLKHYNLITWVGFSSHAQNFDLLAFTKSAILGPFGSSTGKIQKAVWRRK